MKPTDGFGDRPSRIDPDELRSWLLHECDDLLVINKPGWVVCHPSKDGPWSSLVGACKEYLGVEKLHLVARLDRETSGLVLLARNPRTARRLQMALERRQVDKEYLVLLEGHLPSEEVVAEGFLDRDRQSPVHVKQRVSDDRRGQYARTRFARHRHGPDCVLAWAFPETGRKHQIRAHAQWLGTPVAGDKVYGPDPCCFLEFREQGWTPALQARLGFHRQALHAFRMIFRFGESSWFFTAPVPHDLCLYASQRLGLPPAALAVNALLKERHQRSRA